MATDFDLTGSTPTSVYDRVGDCAIREIVDRFYERVLADDELKPFFVAAPIDHLRKMQRELFAVALGGPVTYSGLGLHDAHASLGIQPRHVSRFMEHLARTLTELGIEEDAVDALLGRLSLHVDDIVGGEGEDG